jgi:hypothetical protein
MRAKFIVTVWLLFGAFSTHGVLAPPPDSYLLVSADQSRCLVMAMSKRSRIWSGDMGRMATLPDGRRVDVYLQFPTNGVYRLPDLSPVYFLDGYFDSNRLAFSPDFGAIAVVNEYALEYAPATVARPEPKAIRFFNWGEEVRAYSAAELVENPTGFSLAPDDYGRFSRAWLKLFRLVKSDQLEVVTIPRGLFFHHKGLEISKGNRFVFDLPSGAPLSEDRPFARLRRWVALGLAAVVGLGLAVFVFKRSQATPG